jgi:hypothetical protein
MKPYETKTIIIGVALNFIGAGLAIFGNKIIGIILISIGFIGIIIVVIEELIKKTAEIFFYDDFSEPDLKEWKTILNGGYMLSSERSYSGSHSFKKIIHNDPSGAYRLIDKTLKTGFCFSGWIYRPSNFSGGENDRIALEDKNGNGYGFLVGHRKDYTFYCVEMREYSFPSGTFHPIYQIRPDVKLTDTWYNFEFTISPKGEITFRIHWKGNSFSTIKINPTADAKYPYYDSFNRIAIQGGCEYFVDDLKIIKL